MGSSVLSLCVFTGAETPPRGSMAEEGIPGVVKPNFPPPYEPAPPPQVLVVERQVGPPGGPPPRHYFGDHPTTIQCPYCSAQVTTAVESTCGVAGWVVAAACLFGGCWCCCFIP